MADDVVFNITGDSSQGVAALNELGIAANDLKTVMTEAADAIKTAFDGLNQIDLKSLGLDTLAQSAQVLATAMADMGKGFMDAADGAKALQIPLEEVVTLLDAMDPALLAAASSLAGTSASASTASVGLDEVVAAVDRLAPSLDSMDKSLDQANVYLEQLVFEGGVSAEALDRIAIASEAAATSLERLVTLQEQQASSAAAATAATTQEATATQEAAAAHANHAQEGGMDAMMLMMIVPILLQAAQGFIQMGTAAEDSIAHIKGLADQSLMLQSNAGTLNTVIGALEQESMRWGVSMKDAADGMYYIESAAFNTSDSLKILNVAMEASAATGAQMTNISNSLTSVLHAYGLGADQATKITNEMVATVVAGKQNFDEFARVIGRVAEQGQKAGFSFEEVAAAEATMTQINPSVQRDTQNLNNLFIQLADNTDKIKKAADGLGLKFDEQKFKTMDLIDKLKYLAQVAGGDNTAAFQKLLLNMTAANAAYMILNSNGSLYGQMLDKVKNSQDALSTAMEASSQTISFAWNRITAAMSVVSYQLVSMIGPFIGPLLTQFADMLDKVAMNAQVLTPIFIGLAAALGGILLGSVAALVALMGDFLMPIIALAVPLGLLAAGAVIAAQALRQLMQSASPVAATMRLLMDSFRAAAEYIESSFAGVGTSLTMIFHAIGTIITSVVIPAIASFVAGLGGEAVNGMFRLGDAIRSGAGLLREFAVWLSEVAVPALQRMSPAINQAAATLGHLSPIIATVIAGLFGIGPAVGILSFAFDAIGTAGGLVVTVLRSLASVVPLIVQGFELLKIAAGTVLGGFVVIYDAISGLVKFLIGALPAAIQAVSGAFTTLRVAVAMGASPFEILVGVLQGGISTIGGFLGSLASLIAPFILIGIAVAAAVAAMVAWFTQTRSGQGAIQVVINAVMQLWNVLVASLQPAIQAARQAVATLGPVWNQLVVAVQPLYPLFLLIGAILGGTLVSIIGVVISLLASLIAALGQFVAGAIKAVTGVIQVFAGLLQFFSGFISIFVDLFTGHINRIPQDVGNMGVGLKNIWQGLWTAIGGVWQATVGGILAGIGQFITTITTFFTNLANVIVGHSIWPDMWQAIANTPPRFFGSIIGGITGFMSNVINLFTQMAGRALNAVIQGMTMIGIAIVTAVLSIAQVVQSGLQTIYMIFATVFNQCFTIASTSWQQIQQIITIAVLAIFTIISTTFQQIWQVITTAMQQIWQIITVAWQQIQQIFQTALMAIQALLQGNFTLFFQLVNTIMLQIQQLITTVWAAIVAVITNALTQIWNIIQTNFNLIYNLIMTVLQQIVQIMTQAWQDMYNAVLNGVQQIIAQVQNMVSQITSIIQGLISQAFQWGSDFINAIANGITSGIGAVQNAVNSVAAVVSNVLHHTKPEVGPLADDDTWMPDMMQQFAQDIENHVPMLQGAALKAAGAVANVVPQPSMFARGGPMPSSNSSEHIAVLKQILEVLQQMKSGQGGNAGTAIGYNIPSTVLGSITQQFGNQRKLSSNDIADIYNQINTLAGLSSEYAGRGAITGVGF